MNEQDPGDQAPAPEMTHYWRVRTRMADRVGQQCRVLARGALNSCLVEFEDGYRVITSRWYVRRIKGERDLSGGQASEPGQPETPS